MSNEDKLTFQIITQPQQVHLCIRVVELNFLYFDVIGQQTCCYNPVGDLPEVINDKWGKQRPNSKFLFF